MMGIVEAKAMHEDGSVHHPRRSTRAAQALRKHRNRAAQIMAKVSAYAADPASLANNVTPLRGEEAKRLRVGDFRVIFTETEADVTILDIGPRGSIYD